ncbi:hypothetical protein [Massilibacteroides sp.]|uniref:hypothetical protein n=1 Tax=Massilibacteroides sp. TaxID=2034766 RepID=UPI00262EDB65|nr:hypothetical protein [Massilibacteroides sp.]MDD4516011.1 hypothetical protein [Massilibacteroides sp.]
MRRIAAHYIYWKELLPIHYIELDENRQLIGVFPLKEEIAGTEFWDGIVCPVPVDYKEEKFTSLDALIESGIVENVEIGSHVFLYRFSQ